MSGKIYLQKYSRDVNYEADEENHLFVVRGRETQSTGGVEAGGGESKKECNTPN